MITRRRLLGEAGLAGLAIFSQPARAETTVKLALPGGVDARPITTAFPQKGAMVLQRTTAPLLETPFEVFDQGVLTPNERFFVRWHWPLIPTRVNVDTFRLNVHGHVDRMLSLSLEELMALPQFEIAAVNQCSAIRAATSSRALPAANGAMGRWATRVGAGCG
jgi:DMSO/TMAO reductase YedYZ molybdopterin-dependent catalytic subunit